MKRWWHTLCSPALMRFASSLLAAAFLMGADFVLPIRALTLEQLQNAPDLSPQSFAQWFAGFQFRFHNEVQRPEIFLVTQSGDCDDYATLAADLLKRRGYTPRLVAVRMPRIVHVICYIEETGSYLDYNHRGENPGTVYCGPAIGQIADSVAKDYALRWTSASEFKFEAGAKRLVQTILGKERQVAANTR